MADDEYAPAITDTVTNEAGAESTITTRTPEAAAAPAISAGETGDDPTKPPGQDPRGQRVISDKTRAMFREIAKASAKAESAELGGIPDDLVPMDATTPPAAAAPAVAEAATASPVVPPPAAAAAAPVAPPPAPALPAPPMPDVAKAASEQARLLHEVRTKQLEDREAAIVEREKQLPSRTDLIERPGATLMAYLRDVYGVGDDEIKDVLTDVVTELSETALGVKLPDEVKTKMESRKAIRSMKAYKADLQKREQTLADQRVAADNAATAEREKQETAQRERRAVAQVSQLLADPATRTAHKFLHDPEANGGSDPAAIVIEVVKEQIKAGQPANWQTAARYADDYFKAQAEALSKKSAHLQSLLAPVAPAAPAKAATPPGGLPGPSPKTPPTPAPTATPDPLSESSDEPAMDRRDRRAQQLRAIARKHKVIAAP